MSSDEPAVRVAVNRIPLVLWVTIGSTVGIIPFSSLVDRFWVVPVTSLAALVSAWIASRSLKSRATYAPGRFETFLAGVGSVANCTLGGFIAVVFYGAAYFFAIGIRWLIGWLEWSWRVEPTAVAFWVGLGLGLFTACTQAALAVRELGKQLYPNAAGLRSSFYSLGTFSRRRAYQLLTPPLIAIGGVLLVASFPGAVNDWLFAILAPFLLIGLSVPVEKAGEVQEPILQAATIVDAVKAFFEAAGYEVVVSPRTGREKIDPLLARSPRLYAEGNGRAFAIDISTPGEVTDGDESWHALSELNSAAWALTEFIQEGAAGTGEASAKTGDTNARTEEQSSMAAHLVVKPLVVLVGVEPSLAVKIFEAQEHLRVVRIPNLQTLNAFLKPTPQNEQQRRELARSFLEFQPVEQA